MLPSVFSPFGFEFPRELDLSIKKIRTIMSTPTLYGGARKEN